MHTIAIISQKGGAGKTTLAVHLATEAHRAGSVALILDADPQATASTWSQWRGGAEPEVIDCAAPPLIPRKLEQAASLGAEVAVIDTPPHAEASAVAAAKAADLILIPCRPRAFDLDAIRTTADLASRSGKPAFVVFMGGPVRAPNLYREAGEVVAGFGLAVAPVVLSERAAFHHSVGSGKVAAEIDHEGRAAEEVAALWRWARQEVSAYIGGRVYTHTGAAA